MMGIVPKNRAGKLYGPFNYTIILSSVMCAFLASHWIHNIFNFTSHTLQIFILVLLALIEVLE